MLSNSNLNSFNNPINDGSVIPPFSEQSLNRNVGASSVTTAEPFLPTYPPPSLNIVNTNNNNNNNSSNNINIINNNNNSGSRSGSGSIPLLEAGYSENRNNSINSISHPGTLPNSNSFSRKGSLPPFNPMTTTLTSSPPNINTITTDNIQGMKVNENVNSSLTSEIEMNLICGEVLYKKRKKIKIIIKIKNYSYTYTYIQE